MAEGEEKKSWGGDEKKSVFPPGFRFTPSDEELVRYYLLPKLQGKKYVPNDAIIEADVYQCHPDKLIDMYKDRGEDSWYFLSQRARKYQNGDRPSRNTDDNRGRWKASTGKSEAKEAAGDGKTTYCESVLAYFEGPIKTEKKTKWLMHELTIPQYENKIDKSGGGDGRSSNSKTLDEYVMCKIYVTPRHKGNDDEAGPRGTCQQVGPSQPGPVESGQGTAAPKLSERQAGKRPVEEQPRGGATTPKRAHRPNLHDGPPPPAPPYGGGGGGGMQVPFRAAGYYGGTGQPMVHYVRTPMPRPPVAYNGQVRPPALKLSLPYRATGMPNSCGQSQAMMTRPSNPDGQAVKRQRQEQPETEEMRKKRVYQQHLDELRRMQRLMQPPGGAAYPAPQQRPTAFAQQQQPYFGAGVNHHHVGAMVPQFPPYNYQVAQQYECSWIVPATSDSGGATSPASAECSVSGAGNEGSGERDCNNDDEKHFELSAVMKTSSGGSSSGDGDGP